MSDNRTKEEIKAAMRKAADFFGQHVNHRTKRVDEISVTEHMLKMSQRIAELEAENARLRGATVGAIPESGYYADGWNDCRKAYREAIDAARKVGEQA